MHKIYLDGKARRKETTTKKRIKLYLREMKWIGLDWIHLAQDIDQ
jgi:hypothetical protein